MIPRLLLLAVLCGVAQAQVEVDVRLSTMTSGLVEKLRDKRVVFVGETHDRYDHHLNQLEVIRQMHKTQPGFAIGLEYFQRFSQDDLDDYIAGKLDEKQMLRATGYYDNWGYDYRLYAPILRFAREQHIPLLALNVPSGLTSMISKFGIAGLTQDWKDQLPKEMGSADAKYRERLRTSFEQHEDKSAAAFERFVEAQLVWDEGMAERAAEYLKRSAGNRLVVLAGSGHMFADGIPERLKRRTGASYSVVLSNSSDIEAGMGDILLLSPAQTLPPAGILGVRMHDGNQGCAISDLVPGGAAAQAGLRKDDMFVDIDGEAVHTSAEVKVALWERKPGDKVHVRVLRGKETAEADVELKAAQ
jgi:uncharacterized iron-regulated protein